MRTAIYAGGEFAVRDKSDGFLPPLLAAVLGRIAKWRRERAAIAYLSGMSDAMLRDMGITRGEIEEAVRHGRPSTSAWNDGRPHAPDPRAPIVVPVRRGPA